MVGYVTIKWLTWHGKIFYNIIPYNRIISMKLDEYFFQTQAKNSGIYEGNFLQNLIYIVQ